MSEKHPLPSRVAVIPVRTSVLPLGALETIVEASGRAVLIGSGLDSTVEQLVGVASEVTLIEAGSFAPAAWADHLGDVITEDIVILPASQDGRDLAPRLAATLGRDLIASALRVSETTITTVLGGGRVQSDRAMPAKPSMVVTLQPGVIRLAPPADDSEAPRVTNMSLTNTSLTDASLSVISLTDTSLPERSPRPDAKVIEVLAPDVSTMDLSEAPRLLGGGAGLDSADRFAQLASVARSLDAAMGATRVITDRGWIGHERQIGTTGVVVDPDVYVAFGISGAVQHTAGLGDPDHIISVNTDEHCPMMTMADLAIVAEANQTLDEIERLIVERTQQ